EKFCVLIKRIATRRKNFRRDQPLGLGGGLDKLAPRRRVLDLLVLGRGPDALRLHRTYRTSRTHQVPKTPREGLFSRGKPEKHFLVLSLTASDASGHSKAFTRLAYRP